MAASPFWDPRVIIERAKPLIAEVIREIRSKELLDYTYWLKGEGRIRGLRGSEELVQEYLKETGDTDEAR